MVRLLSLLILIASPAHASNLITVTYNEFKYQLDVSAISSVQEASKRDIADIHFMVRSKIDYLFVVYAAEQFEDIAAKIAATSRADDFGRLTLANGKPILFRCPNNARGPVPILENRSPPSARTGVLIDRRRVKVRETAQEVIEVLDGCGGKTVPAMPN